ncbi:hypothetical protein ABPG72_018893 [Tetrahymena utriculariae]
MGNCMKSKGQESIVEPEKVNKNVNRIFPQQASSQIQQQQKLDNQKQNENEPINFQNVDDEQNKEVKPSKELSKMQLMKLQKKKEQQKLKQYEQIKPMFDYLVEKAQEENPSEVDFQKVSQLMEQQNSKIINQCMLYKEISGCTLSDYCLQNQHIFILKFVFERLQVEDFTFEDLKNLANIIFKGLISSSKQFNKRPEFFFCFLDLIENSEALGKLFSLYLETANPYCFLQFINLESEQAQLFLERVKQLIQKPIENEGHQKEIELLNVVLKIQQNFLLDQYFVKFNLPKNVEVLKRNLYDSNLKSTFTDRQFDISQGKQFQKKNSLIESEYNFGHYLASKKRLELVQQNWSVYLELLLEKESSRNTGVSIIFQQQKANLIIEMIEAYKANPNLFNQLLKISNQANQNLIHMIIQNKNLSPDNIVTIIQKIFANNLKEKENLLIQYDYENNIPLSVYLKKKTENKDLKLVELLIPEKLKNIKNNFVKYPLLDDLHFPLYEFQKLQMMLIPCYIWRVYPMLQKFYDDVDALNNQIFNAILSLKSQRNQIYNMIGNSLCLALKKGFFENLLQQSEHQMATKYLSDQRELDESRTVAFSQGQKQEIINYMIQQSNISKQKYYQKFVNDVIDNKLESASALQMVVTAKLRQELGLVELNEELLKKNLDEIFEQYLNQKEYFEKESLLEISQNYQQLQPVFYLFGSLQDQKYFHKIKDLYNFSSIEIENFKARTTIMAAYEKEIFRDQILKQDNQQIQENQKQKKENKQINFRKIKLDFPYLLKQPGFAFVIILSQVKKQLINILAEEFFKQDYDFDKLLLESKLTKLGMMLIVNSPEFKQVLTEKGIKAINQNFFSRNKKLLLLQSLECTNINDNENLTFIRWQYYPCYNIILDLISKKQFSYYKENAQKIIQNLIGTDLLGIIQMNLPCQCSFNKELLSSLKQSDDVYMNLFYELMTTSKNVFQILLSKEKYMKILKQISINQQKIIKQIQLNIHFATLSCNLPALQWVFSTVQDKKIDTNQEKIEKLESEQEEYQIQFKDLFKHTFYGQSNKFSEDQAEMTEEQKKQRRSIQWNIFKEIRQRFREQTNSFNPYTSKLYEHYGLKFSVSSKDFDPKIISSDYLELVTIIKYIYSQGEKALIAQRDQKQQLLDKQQIELIVEEFLKRIEELYKGEINEYQKKSDKTEDKTIQIYYKRRQIIDCFQFVQEQLFYHVIDNKKIQLHLLNLGNQAIYHNDLNLLQIINKMFCQSIKDKKEDYSIASSFINQIVYPFFLQIQIESNKTQQIQLPNETEANKEKLQFYKNQFNEIKYTEVTSKIVYGLKKKNLKIQQIKHDTSKIQFHKISSQKPDQMIIQLILSTLSSSNQKLLMQIARIVSLIYSQKSSMINKFFLQFRGYQSEQIDFVYFFQIEKPIYFSRYFSIEKFDSILRGIQQECSRQLQNEILTNENQKRTKFIVQNTFKDIARHGQIQKWENAFSYFKEALAKDYELDVIQCCINAYAGRLLLSETSTNENLSIYPNIRNFLSKILNQRNCIDSIKRPSSIKSYSSIILNCISILQNSYQKSSQPLELEYKSNNQKFNYTSVYSLQMTLNILYFSLIYHFDDTFSFVKYLHHKKNLYQQTDESGILNVEQNNNHKNKELKKLWKNFILKSLRHGALSHNSFWSNSQLKQFLHEFENDYIEIITVEESNDINSDVDLDEKDCYQNSIIPFNSQFSEVNQEYINFFIKNKSKLTPENKQILQVLLDEACLSSISYFKNSDGQKSYSKKYLLDAMKNFEMKLNCMVCQDKNKDKHCQRNKNKVELELLNTIHNQRINIIENQNKLNQYITQLSDDDLEHALSLGLFNLYDKVVTRISKQKILFLKLNAQSKNELVKDSKNYQSQESTFFNAIQHALVIGRDNFINLHQNILIETMEAEKDQKLALCTKFALLSGRLEIFSLFFEKIPTNSQKYTFLKDQKILFQLARFFIGQESLFKYLVVNYYCNSQFISQNGKGEELLEFDELISDQCIVLNNLVIMKQEEALLDIFSYILNNYSQEKKELLKQNMCYFSDDSGEEIMSKLNKKIVQNPISAFDAFYLFKLYNLRCFLLQNGMIVLDELSGNVDLIQDMGLELWKTHQQLESQNLVKAQESRSELYTHLNIIFQFLLQELTSSQVSLSAISTLENSFFGFISPKKHLLQIYQSLSVFIQMQITQIIYTFCEIFNINLHNLMQSDITCRKNLQRSELFNIYLLKHSIYPDINIIKIIQDNPSYFKNCKMAKFLNKLNGQNIQPSISFLQSFFSKHFSNENRVTQLMQGEQKFSEIKNLISQQYNQRELIKILCDKEQEYITQNEEIFKTILLDASLAIYLLKDNPFADQIIEQYVQEINDNREQYQIIQRDKYQQTKFKTEFEAKATAEFQKEFTDSPFNKVLRSLVYYFSVQKGESLASIFEKVFISINIFSKQGLSFQYHLLIIKNAREITESSQDTSQKIKKKQNPQINEESIRDLVEDIIYNKFIKSSSEFYSNQIVIYFNNFFQDIFKFVSNENNNAEKQYSLLFQTVFRFFQTIYSLHIADSFPEKQVEISLIEGNEPMHIEKIVDFGLTINLFYNYNDQQFTLNASDVQPLIDQVENYYFFEKNMPFIEQQIEIFNNRKDRLIRQSQFGAIPFMFDYESIQHLQLIEKREILNQIELRSQELLKSEFKKQLSQNSQVVDKTEHNQDSNTYFGLYSLVEDISMYLSFLNIKQKEFYALNDMFAPHNNAMMNPIEQQQHIQQSTTNIQQSQLFEADHRTASQTMIGSQAQNMNSRIGGQQTRENQNVLNSIKMHGAIFSYYLEQLPDNTYKVNLKKNSVISKSPSNQLLFSEFYEFCPFKEGKIDIVYIPLDQFLQKTRTQSIYNTLLAQVISYEQHFMCSLKNVEDYQNVDSNWYYSIDRDKQGNTKIVYKKELFAGYNLLRIKQMMNDFENELSFGKKEEISQKWKINVQSLLEVIVSGLFNIARGSSAYDCERCSVDRDSIFSLFHYILSSPLLKKIIHIILYQNFSESGNIMKVIKGIYFEFNEIEINDLPQESKLSDLDQYLEYGLDQIIRIGKTEYYIHKFMLVIRINLCFIKNNLSLIQINQNKKTHTEDLILKEIPILKNYIQVITNQYDFYEQIFSPEQIVSFILNKLEIDNHLLSISKNLSKQFSQSQTITFNINYESLYHIFNNSINKAKSIKNPIKKIEQYDKIWKGLNNLRSYLLDQLEKNLFQQLDQQSYQDQFFMIFQNLIYSYENKQIIKKRLVSNYRSYPILTKIDKADSLKQNKQLEADNFNENEDEFDDVDIAEEFTDLTANKKISASQKVQCVSQIRSQFSSIDQLKNTFLIQLNLNDFLLHAKKGDFCFIGYYFHNSNLNQSDYHFMICKIAEKTDKKFIFESFFDYRNNQEVLQENIKFALLNFQTWPNPQLFSGQIQKYCIIDSSLKIQLINSKAVCDICQFFMSEDIQGNQELLEQYQGYLYRGSENLTQDISLNSLIQLMPSNISFVFESQQDHLNDNQFDLLNLQKQQSSIVRNQFDMFDNHIKQVVFKFDENYKFKKPILIPDQFSFASSVDSNQRIQEEYSNLIENFTTLFSKSLLKDSQQQDICFDFDYDPELENMRAINIELIEMNISFVCYNIYETFNQVISNFNYFSPKFVKQILLLAYHNKNSRLEFYNESDIFRYLFVKLITKHIQRIGLQFQPIPEQGDEELQLAIYDDNSKSFTINVFIGKKLDQIIIPSTIDLSYNLLKQLVICELKYIYQKKYLSKNIEAPQVDLYQINQDLKDFNIKMQNDLKSFSNLHQGEYQILIIQLLTLSFSLRSLAIISKLKSINSSQFQIQFCNKQSSSFQKSQNNSSDEILVNFGYGSLSFTTEFFDIIHILSQDNNQYLNVLFYESCNINIQSQLEATASTQLVINQACNQLLGEASDLQQITNQNNYQVKMIDLTDYNQLTVFDVEQAIQGQSVQLKLKQDLSHLQGQGHHFVYVVYFNKQAISFNYLIKSSDELIQHLIQQNSGNNYKINQDSLVIIQQKAQINITQSIFDGINLQFSQAYDDISVSISSYAQRYAEIVQNKKIRLIKINSDKTSKTIFFTFDINSRFISNDTLLLTIRNTRSQTLNILNSCQATIISNSKFPKDIPKEIQIKYSSTSKILIEKTHLKGCVVEQKEFQPFQSKKDKQKKDNLKTISPLFKIFKPKTVTRLIESNEEIEFIESEKQLKKYQEIQRQVFMEDGRQSMYSRAGETRKDVFHFYDGFGNIMQSTEPLETYQVIFVHILFTQIKFKGKLAQSKVDNEYYCEWRPLIKGSYRMYINGIYIPQSEEMIGIIANTINENTIKIETSDQQMISYYDTMECQIYYKDIYGNNYTQFDKTTSNDPFPLEIKCNSNDPSKAQNLEFAFSQGNIDKVGKQKVTLKFDSKSTANLNEPNPQTIIFLYSKKQLHQFNLNIQGMNFEKRKKQFQEAIQKYKKNTSGQSVKINRDKFAEELLTNFESFDLKNALYINFKDEKGIDAGGLRREFYELVGKMMKDSTYQFFELSSGQNTEKYYFHKNCLKMKQSVQYFKIFGKFIAHTILYEALLGIEFCEPLYKLITKQDIKFEDLKHVLDSQTYNNYKMLKELDAESLEDMCLFFTYIDKGKMIDLIPNGGSTQVNKDNLEKYLQETSQYLLQKRFQNAITHLQEGFESVFPSDLLFKFIHPNELSIYTCGLKEIDGAFLQKLSTFSGGNSILQNYFYRYLSESSTQMLQNFLKFITGSGSIPFDYSNFKLVIDFISSMNINKLPISHTCFRSIEVPYYKSYEQMKAKFDLAFTLGSEGFAFG